MVRRATLEGGDVGGRHEADGTGVVWAVSGPAASADDDAES